MSLDLAIKLGSSYTSIFMSGQGVVLREPTVAAITADGKKIKAVGNEALAMLGRTTAKVTVISPVRDGKITEPRVCAMMLREFIRRLFPESYIFRPKVNIILSIPTGLSADACREYEDVCMSAGADTLYLVSSVILAAIGLDLPVNTPTGHLVVSIGGGITDVGAISLNSVVAGYGVSLGGQIMDRAISDYIAGKYNLRVGLNTIRRAKEDISTLYKNDLSFTCVRGHDLSTKNAAAINIRADEIAKILSPYYMRVAEVIESTVNACQPEISADILRGGVHVVGGAAKILGLEQFFADRLRLKIRISSEPELAAVLGGGKLLKNRELLEQVLS